MKQTKIEFIGNKHGKNETKIKKNVNIWRSKQIILYVLESYVKGIVVFFKMLISNFGNISNYYHEQNG